MRPTLPYSTYALSRRITPNSYHPDFLALAALRLRWSAKLPHSAWPAHVDRGRSQPARFREIYRASPANLRTRHVDLELVVCPRDPSRAALSARGPGLLLVRADILSLEDRLLSFNAPVIMPFSSPDLRSALSSPPVRAAADTVDNCDKGAPGPVSCRRSVPVPRLPGFSGALEGSPRPTTQAEHTAHSSRRLQRREMRCRDAGRRLRVYFREGGRGGTAVARAYVPGPTIGGGAAPGTHPAWRAMAGRPASCVRSTLRNSLCS